MTELPHASTSLLFVEGNDSDALRFEVMLELASPAEFVVERATTLTEAISCLAAGMFACVVVGLRFVDAEALAVLARLSEIAPTVALIVLTEEDEGDLGVAVIQRGASDLLSKRALGGGPLVHSIRFAILRKRFENSLDEAQSIAGIGSWDFDTATRATRWSRQLYRLLGFGLDEKPTIEAIAERVHPEDQEAIREAMQSAVAAATPFMIEHRLVLPDGATRWVRASGRIEFGSGGAPERVRGTVQDITEQKSAADALMHQGFHDPLSGLANRLLFLDRLGQSLKRLKRHPSTVCVIYLDVDRFNVINDSIGRTAGDQLLLAMAARLSALVRPGDTLARVGGDEFAMLCEALPDESGAVGVAERVRIAMTEPVSWKDGQLVLSASAGVILTRSSSDSPESLLRDAEAAMYRAKSEGRARSTVIVGTMRTKALGRLDTESSLRRAITNGELRVHYQQIVSLSDAQILGHEALVRWAHPTRGLLGPDEFITVAEETGLIVPLGTAVLREACRQAKAFQLLHPAWSRLTMSINLSGGQLSQSGLPELVASALGAAGLRPEHLQLEMTESVLMDDAAATITILQSLKALGIRLGIDDFGTGYSSLSYLRRFPVDVIKIDRSFVNGLGKDLEDSAVVAAIASLADTLGLGTVAEGVETPLQRDCLLALGCTRAQGFLFARPVEATECTHALRESLEENTSAVRAPA
jgi:diguanylate cyclase (GGDEF)-like protein/PAS domain S-box-containing protein